MPRVLGNGIPGVCPEKWSYAQECHHCLSSSPQMSPTATQFHTMTRGLGIVFQYHCPGKWSYAQRNGDKVGAFLGRFLAHQTGIPWPGKRAGGGKLCCVDGPRGYVSI